MPFQTRPATALIAGALIAMAAPAAANEYADALSSLVDEQLRAIASSPALIAAIKEQNDRHAGLTDADIDALDKDWRAQVGAASAPLIDKTMGADASTVLVDARNGGEGLFTEVFAMDNRGLNVAASDVTSDYWQGDEAKWKDTFLAGPDAVHISEVELDESTQSYQSQVSLTVVDPEAGAPIGAITFGINIEYLE